MRKPRLTGLGSRSSLDEYVVPLPVCEYNQCAAVILNDIYRLGPYQSLLTFGWGVLEGGGKKEAQKTILYDITWNCCFYRVRRE